jgi:large subunit ribosomal protein L10
VPKQDNIDAVAGLTDQFGKSPALYFLDFTKLAANDFNALRRKLDELGVSIKVVKNSLALRALEAAGASGDFSKVLRGPTSVVFAREDPVAPARVLREQMKKVEAVKVKGAYLDRTLYDASRFEFLASLPTKGELRGQVVAVLQGPVYGLVFTLDGLLSELVRVLEALKDRLPAAAPEVPAAG